MKKILIIALALMLALSLCACNSNDDPEDGTGSGAIDLNPEGTGTGAQTGDPSTDGTGNAGGDNETQNPPAEEIFTDLEQTIFIVASAATIRSEARVDDSTVVNYAAKDAEFKSTAYSANWYKIEYVTEVEVTGAEGEEPTTETQTQTCYVHRSTAFVKDMTATDLEEPLTLYIITYALYVRSYYDFEAQDNLMLALEQGDEVTAVAKGNGWYKIQLADDKDGNPVFGYISANEKYVSTTKPEETTAAEDATTEATEDTTAAEEATTEAAE